jgi:hypothetical protein
VIYSPEAEIDEPLPQVLPWQATFDVVESSRTPENSFKAAVAEKANELRLMTPF